MSTLDDLARIRGALGSVIHGKGEVIGPGESAVELSLALIKKYRYTDEASWQHWQEINADGQRVIIRMTPDQWIWRDV